jgi:hypothetical protein
MVEQPEQVHLRQEQLFALVWAIKDTPPPSEGEGADLELARALRDLPDAYQAPLAVDHRLGPETVQRLMEHTRGCKPCRMMLIEDGPGSRLPRTEGDIAAEVSRKEEARAKQVKRFWLGTTGGVASFVAGQIVFDVWRDKHRQPVETAAETLKIDPRDKPAREIDPLMLGGIALIIVAAVLITDAYMIARELWIDFTRWKRAVPIIGKKWAARDGAAKGPD